MPLAERVMEVMFGRSDPPAVYEVGLAFDNLELQAAGYQRQRVARGDWQVDGHRADVTVTFVFAGPAMFNQARVYAGGELLDTHRMDGDVQVVAGMAYKHRVILTGVTAGG